MKFTVGDKIIIKHTKEEGKIIRIIDEEMVELQVLNTRLPAFIDELELPHLELFSSKKMNAKKRALTLEDFPMEKSNIAFSAQKNISAADTGFFLSVLPVYFFDKEEENIGRLKLYFFNQTEYNIQLKYNCITNLGKEYTLATTLFPFSHLFLHQLKFDLINEGLAFEVDIQHVGTNKEIKKTIKIKPKQIFQKLHQIHTLGQAKFSYEIEKDFPVIDLSRISKENLFNPITKPSNIYQYKPKKNIQKELDLHVEQLLDNSEKLTAHQILEAQLLACEQAIIEAYQGQRPSIIIIHGIGGGKLREEIHKLLKAMKKQVRLFENKYSTKYGFGATEVFLRY
ncbi:MAG TPA: Smr/MutS family protein [Edaphocola sp.]|nr:Smr/MutS family protein [Edaphocola sp.]